MLERENFEYAVVSLVVVILALSAIIYAACKYLNEAKTLSRKHRFRRIQEPSSGTRNAAMLLSRRNLINNAYTGEESYSMMMMMAIHRWGWWVSFFGAWTTYL